MNPGYCFIDCLGVDLLVTTPQAKTGIFENVERAFETGKPCFAYNCIYGTLGYVSPVPVMVNSDGAGGYFATSSILQVHVEPGDIVTVSSLIG